MDRTLVLNLQATPEQARILYRTMSEHTMCFNEVVQTGFTEKCSNGVELHKRTYYPLRAAYRRSQSLFLCRACGYQLNADYNASINIKAKHLASVGTSFAGSPSSSGLSQPPQGELQAPAL